MKAKAWIGAMRLRTLPLAASCVLMGCAIGWYPSDQPGLIFGLTLSTTLLLQILSNLANDYGDFEHGTDNEKRVGPTRAMQSGAISKGEMKRALILTSVLTFFSGIALLWFALGKAGYFSAALILLGIGLAAIAAAIKYTAGDNPYGYRGLGDVFVFLFFGWVGVAGTCFLFNNQLEWLVLLPATTVGFLSAAVLNLNNMRDHVNDAASGKITVVVRMGFERAKVYHSFLIVGAFATYFIYHTVQSSPSMAAILSAPFVLLFLHLIKVWKTAEPVKLDPQLKVVALTTFLLSLIHFVFVLSA